MFKLLFGLLIPFFFMTFTAQSQTWHVIPSGTSKKLNTISFPSSLVGYIGGADSLILKTTNGGITWSPITFTGVTFYPGGDDILDIVFTTEMEGYITVGPYSGTYKTSDGGLTWNLVNNIYICFNLGMYFFDANNGFLGGAGCFSGEIINRLANGVWNETNVNPSYIQQEGMINNFDFSTLQHGLATSTGDYFFHTTDGGVTWDTLPNSLQETDTLTDVQYINNSTVLATYVHGQNGSFGVLISHDAGLTWQPEGQSATFFYPNMFAIEKSDNGHVYIGGENSFTSGGLDPGLIYHSPGDLIIWTYQSVAEGIRDLGSYNDSIVFAVGENGYIIVNQDPVTLDQIENVLLPEIIVYPNPNDGNFIIKTNNQVVMGVQVYDAQGRIIYSFNQQLGDYLLVELPNMEHGIYHVQLIGQNGTTNQQVVIK